MNSFVIKQVGVVICLCLAVTAKAQVNVESILGKAGPEYWTVLETGNGNISISDASNAGLIYGNVGIGNGHNLNDSGTPIEGTVVTSENNPPNLSGGVNPSGGIEYNQSTTINAAINAAEAAEAAAMGLSVSGGGIGYSSINLANNVTLDLLPGVYDLSKFSLGNGDVVNLEAGGDYVFNIGNGGLTVNSAKILAAAGLSDADILFNLEGNAQASTSGGLNNESVIDGVILDLGGNINISPGEVVGEVIGGCNINISSGARVVPEPTTFLSGVLLLLPLSAGTLRMLLRRTKKLVEP